MLIATISPSPSTETKPRGYSRQGVANLKDHRGARNFMALKTKSTGFKMMAAALLASGLGLAQSANPAVPAPQPPKPAAAKPAWPPEGPTPRTADGKPDLSGNWAPNAIRENVDLTGFLAAAGTPVPFLP